MGKSLVSCFFWDTVYIILLSFVVWIVHYYSFWLVNEQWIDVCVHRCVTLMNGIYFMVAIDF